MSRCACEGCHTFFGQAENGVVSFRGQKWHDSCLVRVTNEQVRTYNQEFRVTNLRQLGGKIIDILHELARESVVQHRRFNDVIAFCVDFVVEVMRKPQNIPAEFQLQPVVATLQKPPPDARVDMFA